jgi:membrane protein required for colicin V production
MDLSGAIGWVDGAILLVVGVCLLLGLVTGFVMQLAGILSVVVGILAGILVGPAAATALERWISTPALARLLGYFLCFFVAATIVRLLAALASSLLKKLKLERYDRIAGAGLGTLKGLVICAVGIAVAAISGHEGARKAVSDSALGAPLLAGTDEVVSWFVDEETSARLQSSSKKLMDSLKKLQEAGGDGDLGALLDPNGDAGTKALDTEDLESLEEALKDTEGGLKELLESAGDAGTLPFDAGFLQKIRKAGEETLKSASGETQEEEIGTPPPSGTDGEGSKP